LSFFLPIVVSLLGGSSIGMILPPFHGDWDERALAGSPQLIAGADDVRFSQT
jgi:hypothetical protein